MAGGMQVEDEPVAVALTGPDGDDVGVQGAGIRVLILILILVLG